MMAGLWLVLWLAGGNACKNPLHWFLEVLLNRWRKGIQRESLDRGHLEKQETSAITEKPAQRHVAGHSTHRLRDFHLW